MKIIDTSNKNTAVKISPFNLWFVSSFLIHDPTPPPPTALLYKVITVNIVLLVPWLKMGSPSLIQYENIIFLRRKKDFNRGKSAKRSFFGEKKRISAGENSQLRLLMRSNQPPVVVYFSTRINTELEKKAMSRKGRITEISYFF